ncbi:SDR family NAD(P)-dependent oxidoreductase [Streptomyces sp. MMCC 100]|uniref:SDR family NAD(P)-dependent oxidoreductase n=1 Tax=Streptomyces sp. MMCC 100 TaxID=3163555 RepID=UPI003595CC7E
MSRLDGKVAIVTGAGRGIGQAIAEKFAHEGASVVAADVDSAACLETAGRLGGDALGIGADVTSREAVEAMVTRVRDAFGRIDILVNNAGWDKAGPFADSDPPDWERIVRINLHGVLNTSRAVLPFLVEQGSGSLVNIASDAGRVGSSGEAVYSAAKGGVIAFTKTIAREAARHGVRANSVCPGPTDTDLFQSFAGPRLRESLVRAIPLGRIGTPDDIAGAVAFLASDEAAYITGQTLSVSGGLTMS